MVGFANIFIPLASNMTKNPFRRYNHLHFYMVPDGDVANPVQAMIFRTVYGSPLIGKMVVVEVAMVNPPAVFVAMLVFSPSPELPPNEGCQPVENTL